MVEFYSNYLHSGTIIFEEDGTSEKDWVGNHLKEANQLELFI